MDHFQTTSLFWFARRLEVCFAFTGGEDVSSRKGSQKYHPICGNSGFLEFDCCIIRDEISIDSTMISPSSSNLCTTRTSTRPDR